MAGEVETLAARFARRLKKSHSVVTIAESCTGGLLASTLTDISGSSKWFKQAWVVYSNEVKEKTLGVDKAILDEKGAVNEDVAEQMAKGALDIARADFSIAITGIAGPKADDTDKEVGLVYVSISVKDSNECWTRSTRFSGGRHENKLAFVIFALRMSIEIWDLIKEKESLEINEDEEITEDLEKDNEDFGHELPINEDIDVDDPWGGHLGPDWKEKNEEEIVIQDSPNPSLNTDDVEWEEN